jgi:hypothetical protein
MLPLAGALTCLIVIAAAGGAARIAAAPGDLQVTPGEFVIEHPTLINLGFEWHIDGDANRNARVEVSFRKQAARLRASLALNITRARRAASAVASRPQTA